MPSASRFFLLATLYFQNQRLHLLGGAPGLPRVFLQQIQRHVPECQLVCALEHHRRCRVGGKGFEPAVNAQAPTITRTKACKSPLGSGCQQVIAAAR